VRAAPGAVCSHRVLSTWALCTVSIPLNIFSLACKTAGEVYHLPQVLGFYAVCFIPLLKTGAVLPETLEGRDGGEAIRLEPGKSPCPSSLITLGEPPSFSSPEGHSSGQTAFLFIKQAEVLAAGKVFLAQQTGGRAQSNSTPRFLSGCNMPVAKENS